MRAAADTVSVRSDGGLRLGVIADTHSTPHPAVFQLLRDFQCDAIVHAGDIGDHRVLDRFAAIAPLYPIRGNIDPIGLPDTLTLDIVDGATQRFRLFVVHIGVAGPRVRPDVGRQAIAEGAGLVICGHSHLPFIGRDRGVTVFNPGSVGPRRFQLPIVFGTLELQPDGIRLGHIDCETGRPWLPPASEGLAVAGARRRVQ